MDDIFGEPRCPTEQIIMRDIPGGWQCPSCGYALMPPMRGAVPKFDGPSINGG